MSVLKNKRQISKREFENTYRELYEFNMKQVSIIPRRRQKWLCDDINKIMNQVFIDLMSINDSYFETREKRQEYIASTVKSAIRNLNSLRKPLLILWNVKNYKTKYMAKWVTLIQKEIGLLNNMHQDDNLKCEVIILDWYAIEKANFLKNMSELHRYTHGKVLHSDNKYDTTYGNLLISLVDDAFYELIQANLATPTTKDEYEERRKHISNAITALKDMNRPMVFYFNLMKYSERVMVEWSTLISDELKMLYGLQKSDRKRFSNL